MWMIYFTNGETRLIKKESLKKIAKYLRGKKIWVVVESGLSGHLAINPETVCFVEKV